MENALNKLAVILVLAGISACSQTQRPVQSASAPPEAADFAGSWEKNYQLSDDFNSKFNLYLYDIRRLARPRNARNSMQGGQLNLGSPSSVSEEAIMGLARFTEEITRLPALEITQDQDRIFIQREGSFALECAWFNENFVHTQTPFGSELCGWNQQQLVFRIDLPDNLQIHHQITLGPDGQQMNITTTVSSGSVATPLTISNYYERYAPTDQQYDCVLTLTHNTVCRQGGSEP